MSRLGAQKKRERALSVAAPQSGPVYTRQAPPATISGRGGGGGPISYTELSWGQVQSIITSAERGYTEQWVDLTRRMSRTDAHLGSLVQTYTAPVASARREVKPADVPQGMERFAQLAADDCRALLDSLPNVERTFAELIDADFTGFAVQEIIWKPRGEMVWVDALEWLHPRRFRFSDTFEPYLYDNGTAATRAQELGLDAVAREGQILGLPLTARKYIVHVPRIGGAPDYATAGGLYRLCVRPWWGKSWATKFWLSGAEVTGNPRSLGTVPQDAPQAVLDELYTALSGLSADGIGVVRDPTRIEILDAKMPGTGSVWESLGKRFDAEMSKAILGSTLNVEVGDTGGNRSLGESQKDTTIGPRMIASARSLANTIERDLFKPFLEFNRHRYGGLIPLPRLELVLYEEVAEVDDTAVNAGVVTVDELRASRGLDPRGKDRGGERLVSIALPATAPDPTPVAPTGPTADVAEVAGVEKAADAALNGAQVASLLEIVSQVAMGQIPRASGIAIITAAFPLTPAQAEGIMGPVGTPAFTPAPEGGEAAPAAPAAPPPAPTATASVEAGAAVPFRQRAWDRVRALSSRTTT